MLGLGSMGQTSDNLLRTRECVINLPSIREVSAVDRLALTTGKNPVPERKRSWGYRFEAEKFREAGLTPVASESVAAPRVVECPVQMEGIVHEHRPFGKNVSAIAFEIHITRLHVDEALLAEGRDGATPAHRPRALAAAPDELLPLLRPGRRSPSVASRGVGLHEDRRAGNRGARDLLVRSTRSDRPMVTVNIHEAKTQLSKLVEKVVQGETLVIARAGKPLVKVTALGTPSAPRRLGFLAGQIAVPADFDRMGEAEIARLFGVGA